MYGFVISYGATSQINFQKFHTSLSKASPMHLMDGRCRINYWHLLIMPSWPYPFSLIKKKKGERVDGCQPNWRLLMPFFLFFDGDI